MPALIFRSALDQRIPRAATHNVLLGDMMFANIKVATRLGRGFGAVVVLLLVLSVVSVMRLATLNDGVRRITVDRYPKVVLSKDVIRYTIDNGRQLRSMMLSNTDEERDKFRRLVETNRGKVT